MNTNFIIKKAKLCFSLFLLMILFGISGKSFGQETLFEFKGTSNYQMPPAAGWSFIDLTTTSTPGVAGGGYIKLSPGSITSPLYTPYDNLIFKYDIAAFGNGSNPVANLYILNENDAIQQTFTLTQATSSTYVKNQTLNIGNIGYDFKVKIECLGTGENGAGKVKGTRLQNISLTGTEPVPAGTVATPVFSMTSGTLYETTQISITCETEDAIIYYTTDGTTPDQNSNQYLNSISVSTTMTIKAIATKAGQTTSEVAEVTYTFPIEITSIADLKNQTVDKTTVYKLTEEVTFIFKNNKNIYVQNNNSGLLIFDSNSLISTDLVEGDKITNIYGVLDLYNGLLEFIPTKNITDVTSNPETIMPVSVTMEELVNNFDNYISRFVKLTDVTFASGSFGTGTNGNILISQGTNSMYCRNQFNTLTGLTPVSPANVTGFVVPFVTADKYDKQIAPRNESDIVTFVSPTISINNLPESLILEESYEFTVSTLKNDYDGGNVFVKVTVPEYNKITLEYYETSGSSANTWQPLQFDSNGICFIGPQGTGFPLMDLTSKFRVTANTVGEVNVNLEIVKFDDLTNIIASAQQSVSIVTPPAPSMTCNLPAEIEAGTDVDFSVVVTTNGVELGNPQFRITVDNYRTLKLSLEEDSWSGLGYFELNFNDNVAKIYNYSYVDSTFNFRLKSKNTGDHFITFEIMDNQTVVSTKTVNYKSTGNIPELIYDPLTLDFGDVMVNTTKELTFTATPKNLTSDVTMSITGMTTDGYTITPNVIPQNTTEPMTITVTFKPTKTGLYTRGLAFTGSNLDIAKLSLKGKGIAPSMTCNLPAEIEAGTDVDFSVVVTTNGVELGNPQFRITVDNYRTLKLSLEEDSWSGLGYFELNFNDNVAKIYNYSYVDSTFNFRLKSKNTGDHFITFEIMDNQTVVSTKTVNYKSTGNIPELIYDPLTLDFGDVLVNTTKELTFTATPKNLTSDVTMSITGMATDGYTITPNVIPQNTTEPMTITVTFKPTKTGLYTRGLAFTGSNLDIAKLSLKGKGIAPSMTCNLPAEIEAGTDVDFSVVVTTNGVELGYPQFRIIVDNHRALKLSLEEIDETGTDYIELNFEDNKAKIYDYSLADATLNFRLKSKNTGDHFITFEIMDDQTVVSTKTVNYKSTGNIPELIYDPVILDFGDVAVNTTKELTFTATPKNLVSDVTMSITGISTDGYTITPNVIPQNTTEPMTITVTFKPTKTGSYSRGLGFTGTGLDDIARLSLRGNGIAAPEPSISLTPANLPTFITTLGTTSDAQSVTVAGSNLIEDITITIGGTDATMFTFTKGTSWNDKTGGSISIVYNPTVVGSHTAKIVITSGTVSKEISLNGQANKKPLAAPVALMATEVTSNQFTANWNSVEGATSYLLTVVEGTIQEPRKELPMELEVTGTSFEVTGLKEKTLYSYVLVAKDGNLLSERSNIITVETPDGISELEQNADIFAFGMNINVNLNMNIKAKVAVIDLNGRTIIVQDTDDFGMVKFDVDAAQGAYIIRIITTDNSFYKKVILK